MEAGEKLFNEFAQKVRLPQPDFVQRPFRAS
jgi:hypothetical protein